MSGYVITTPGTVIDGRDVNGQLTVAAADVVIRNSRITARGASFGVYVRSGSATITNVEITGSDTGIAGDRWSATRVDIHGTTGDGVKAGSDVLLEDSWIHDPAPGPGAHFDGLQMQSGVVRLTVRNNVIDVSGAAANSALFLAPDLGPSSAGPVLIEGNRLDGGNFTVYCVDGNDGQYLVDNITIRNNVFGTQSAFGASRVNVPVTWTGNVFAGSGRPVPAG